MLPVFSFLTSHSCDWEVRDSFNNGVWAGGSRSGEKESVLFPRTTLPPSLRIFPLFYRSHGGLAPCACQVRLSAAVPDGSVPIHALAALLWQAPRTLAREDLERDDLVVWKVARVRRVEEPPKFEHVPLHFRIRHHFQARVRRAAGLVEGGEVRCAGAR